MTNIEKINELLELAERTLKWPSLGHLHTRAMQGVDSLAKASFFAQPGDEPRAIPSNELEPKPFAQPELPIDRRL